MARWTGFSKQITHFFAVSRRRQRRRVQVASGPRGPLPVRSAVYMGTWCRTDRGGISYTWPGVYLNGHSGGQGRRRPYRGVCLCRGRRAHQGPSRLRAVPPRRGGAGRPRAAAGAPRGRGGPHPPGHAGGPARGATGPAGASGAWGVQTGMGGAVVHGGSAGGLKRAAGARTLTGQAGSSGQVGTTGLHACTPCPCTCCTGDQFTY